MAPEGEASEPGSSSTNEAELSVAADADVAMRLQREEEELDARATEVRRSDEQNDAAIARQLAQLDMEAAPPVVAAAPAALVEGDEALARTLQEEEQRQSQPMPAASDLPLAHARVVYPAREARAVVHRFVSDAADVVAQIGTWFELRVREATREQAADVSPPTAPPAGPHAAAAAAPSAEASTSALRFGAPHVIAAYARPFQSAEVDDDSYVSRGPLQASTEVELVSFGDPDPLAPPEDIRMDAELEELVLGRLCGLLHATLTDGLEQPLLGGLFQGGVRTGWSIFEAWARVIEARCESDMGENERAKPSVCLIGLCKAVLRVAQLYDDEGPSVKAQFPPAGEFKLRALICYGLNVGELHEWFSMLALDGPVEQIYDWYQPNAFVHMRETMLMMAEQLVPLTAHPFRLPLQLECRTITRDSAVYGFSPSQPAHSWL